MKAFHLTLVLHLIEGKIELLLIALAMLPRFGVIHMCEAYLSMRGNCRMYKINIARPTIGSGFMFRATKKLTCQRNGF
jgi:hypothetical protein